MIVAVNDWLSSFEQRIQPFMNTKIVLDDAEIVRIGKKVPDEYPCYYKQLETESSLMTVM